MSEVAQIVLAIFREELTIEVPDVEVDVIETGLLDSLGLVVLVHELELQFDLEIPFESLEVDDFRSVRRIVQLVEAQRGASA